MKNEKDGMNINKLIMIRNEENGPLFETPSVMTCRYPVRPLSITLSITIQFPSLNPSVIQFIGAC